VFGAKLGQERFGASDFALDALNRPDPFTNAATRVSLRQNVWDGGQTTAAGRAARLGVDAAEASLERSRDEVAFAARRAFWDAVAAHGFVEAARDAEKAAAAHATLAGQLVEEGMAVASDRLQAEVRLGEVRALRVRAEQGEGTALAALRRALGNADEEEFVLDPPPVEPDPVEDAEAADVRADLRAFDARIGQASEGESIALAARLPQIGLGAQYEWNGSDPFGASGNNWTVGAYVRIPLYDGCEARGRRARARADRERLEAMRQDLVSGIELQVRAAQGDRASAAERLRTARANVGLATEALRIVRDRYEEGLGAIVELLGAEASATQARAAAVEAERDLAVAGAALDLAAGRPLAPVPDGETGEEGTR